ncbi:rhodanese-like protein [Beggiatoa sp. PS]|nr:rhodanese-like protein [Beggiatoa sp. PS]
MKTMLKLCQLLMIFIFLIALTGCISKDELSEDLPQRKTTQLGLYLSSVEAYDFLKKEGNKVLFIDVRTPGEITAEGMPALADANIPYIMQRSKTEVVVNNDFVPAVEARLKEKGLDKQSPILLICRQGNRSAKAVDALAKVGYQKVYHVVDGANGWKQGQLPWSSQVDSEKMSF